ncbi:MAG: glycosyltransferase [Bacteroidales bacterium]
MWIFLLALILVYTAFVSILASGIIKLYYQNKEKADTESVHTDVIIPFRNEANNLHKLLHDLLNQTYPSSHFHILFIDDHSTDGGGKIINDAIKKHNLNASLLPLTPDKEGKKAALLTGIENSNNPYILTTDADCRMSSNWVKCMITQAKNNQSDLLLGPVIHTGKSVVGRLQSVESLSLLAVTMGTAGLGIPVLSNAANMVIRRNVLKSLQDPFNTNISSGDDIFLMETLKSNKNHIVFNVDQAALVYTRASESWKILIQQRSRWMSKTRHYRFGSSKLTMIIFGIIQMGFLISIPVLIVNQALLILLFLWLFKILYDHLLMYLVSTKYNVTFRLTDTIVFSALYPFWTLITTLIGYYTKALWKGRTVKL